MNKQQITENINSIRNEMTHIWGAFFIICGGSISLILFEPSILKYLIGLIGLVLSYIFITTYMKRRMELQCLINSLEDE